MKKVKLLVLAPILRNFAFSQDLPLTAAEIIRMIDTFIYSSDNIFIRKIKSSKYYNATAVAGLRIFK